MQTLKYYVICYTFYTAYIVMWILCIILWLQLIDCESITYKNPQAKYGKFSHT